MLEIADTFHFQTYNPYKNRAGNGQSQGRVNVICWRCQDMWTWNQAQFITHQNK